jgi:23S rRNA (cytosine1962-C5)-methyltransferase
LLAREIPESFPSRPFHPILRLLKSALEARSELFDSRHEAAFRLFNGFTEGSPNLATDVYGRTLLLHDYSDPTEQVSDLLSESQRFYLENLPWLQAVIVKPRKTGNPDNWRGSLMYGSIPDQKVREQGIWYAVELLRSRDASLYLDTRGVRAWAIQNLAGKRVLNTFAYTGSLGVAACAGGATQVIHLDRNRNFLNVAKASYSLNGFLIHRRDFQTGDFFTKVSLFRNTGELFDCVFLDPPFFSTTSKGNIDMLRQSHRLINKVRPLIKNRGWLVIINNALFLSGANFLSALNDLCSDGYLSIETFIPVPNDFTGFPTTRIGELPVDPSPFNHSTKIVVLKVRRKES